LRFLVQLLRALPVNIEQHIAARFQPVTDLRLGRAIAIAKDRSPFIKRVFFNHAVKFRLIDKVVVLPLNLTGPDRPRSDRNRRGNFIVFAQQLARNRGFSGPGRRGQDEHQAPAVERIVVRNGRGHGC